MHGAEELSDHFFGQAVEPASAIPLLEESLQLKRLLATLVLLITTYLRLDQPEAIEPLIADPSVEDLPGSKHERMVLAQIQMEFGDKQRGIELGYKVLCEAPDRAAIVQRYFGLILKPKAEEDRLQFDAIVGQGAWVKRDLVKDPKDPVGTRRRAVLEARLPYEPL